MNEPQMDLTGSRILAVDDVPANLDVLLETLEEAGYEVLVANDGETALDVAANARPDLILLDVMMPGIDGFETCRRFKADSSLREIPVIFLTARDDIESVVEGFDTGGLDYVVKPFSAKELLARVDAVLRRSPQRSADVEALRFDGRMIDLARREVTSADGSTRQLTDREVAILRYLAVSRKRAVDRRELLQHVWGLNPRGIHTRTVDIHIARLREKIEEDPADPRIILTVRGKGYMLAETVQEVGEVAS